MLRHDIGHGVDDVLHILIAHLGVDGQRDQPQIFAVGDREIFGLVAIGLAVVGVNVQRDEVNARADVARLERVDECGPVQAQPVALAASRPTLSER